MHKVRIVSLNVPSGFKCTTCDCYGDCKKELTYEFKIRIIEEKYHYVLTNANKTCGIIERCRNGVNHKIIMNLPITSLW